MASLAKLQLHFRNALLGRSSALDRLIEESPSFKAGERIAIYKNNFFAFHKKALEQTFPVTARIVGDDYFKQLSHHYSLQFPSSSPDLNQFGERFPQFLELMTVTRSEAAALLYLPHLAWLEWFWHHAQHSGASDRFDFKGFAKLDDDEVEQLTYTLSPSAALIRSPFPIYEIWTEHQSDGEIKEIDLDEKGDNVLVWHNGTAAVARSLPDPSADLIEAVANGEMLRELTEKVPDLPESLSILIQENIITGFSLP